MHHFQLIRCLGRGSGGEAGIMLRMFCACRVGSCFFKIHLQIGRIFTSHFGDHSWFCSFHRGWPIWSLRNAAGHACGRLWWAEVRAEIRATGRWVMQVDALWTLGLLGCHFCQDQWKIQYTQCISYFFIFLIYIVYTFLIFCGYLQGTILWFSIGILDSQFIIFEVWSRSSVIKLFRKWRSCDSASRESFFLIG